MEMKTSLLMYENLKWPLLTFVLFGCVGFRSRALSDALSQTSKDVSINLSSRQLGFIAFTSPRLSQNVRRGACGATWEALKILYSRPCHVRTWGAPAWYFRQRSQYFCLCGASVLLDPRCGDIFFPPKHLKDVWSILRTLMGFRQRNRQSVNLSAHPFEEIIGVLLGHDWSLVLLL